MKAKRPKTTSYRRTNRSSVKSSKLCQAASGHWTLMANRPTSISALWTISAYDDLKTSSMVVGNRGCTRTTRNSDRKCVPGCVPYTPGGRRVSLAPHYR